MKQSEATEAAHLSKLEDGMSKVADPTNTNEINVNYNALTQTLWQVQESEKLRLPLADLVSTLKESN